jgi:signal transduction histidine kinase
VASPRVADRLTILTHELSNMLDGSMRCLSLARQSLAIEYADIETKPYHEARKQIDTVYRAMERMCELVKASMMSSAMPIATDLDGARAFRLNEAVAHAIDVLQPWAAHAGVTITADLDPRLDDAPAGPIYSAALNAIKNAIEATSKVGAGRVHALTRHDELSADIHGRNARAALEIHDQGVGLPTHIPADRLFDHGTSTRGSLGVGLGIIRDVAKELGGRAELLPRGDSGACLRLIFPSPATNDTRGRSTAMGGDEPRDGSEARGN